MTDYYEYAKFDFLAADDVRRRFDKLIHAGVGPGAAGDLAGPAGEPLADTLLRSARQELSGSLRNLLQADTVAVDDAMTLRFLATKFSPEDRLMRIYPWLLAFHTDLAPTQAEMGSAVEALEAHLAALDPASLDLTRPTEAEERLMPLFEAMMQRNEAARSADRFGEDPGWQP